MKKALNLALDLGCENEIIDMINKFINCKKNIIKDANNDENNEENLQILDPIVQKRRGRPPNKRIKSASETNSRHVSTKNSAINPSDPNLYVREVQQHPQQASSSRTPFNVLDTNTSSDFNTQRQERSENTSNWKTYICKVCGEPGHNARTYMFCDSYFNDTPPSDWSYLSFLETLKPVFMSTDQDVSLSENSALRKRYRNVLKRIVSEKRDNEQVKVATSLLQKDETHGIKEFWENINLDKKVARERGDTCDMIYVMPQTDLARRM
ncbi:hypothetical protein RhiirA1_504691 [Rhizophagus irregularis]|uniref:CCHC-type domain-containing protein n=1 Tax=Rhizophagus irregularis TaxID=588596 RepID=A0A2N0QVE4_9GLOM|nr:hypothetical protein RhiirA1_504691 [Rhizophagus irregularis]